MKANLSQNLTFKLAPNENYFTVELVAKDKKKGSFFTSFHQCKWKHESMKANLSQKAVKLGPNVNYFTEELIVNWIQVVYFKLKEIFPR